MLGYSSADLINPRLFEPLHSHSKAARLRCRLSHGEPISTRPRLRRFLAEATQAEIKNAAADQLLSPR